ncbi:MAG: 4Fe-4S dicluster domain-containing protein [Acidobacteriia bacterium]|nr:4Fe-4S dicluster domain-containing protein [Terriglobia bacterium]
MAPQPKRYALIVDSKKCLNCKACVVACRAENQVPLGKSRDWIGEEHHGTWPKMLAAFEPEQCHHCASPACVRVCPTGASWQRKDGVVLVNDTECVGCRYCMIACPYDARFFREDRGVVEKCTFCVQRVDRGEIPACVETCPSKVRVFGDINDADGRLREILNTRQYRLKKPETGNGPQIYYLL